MVSGTEKMHLCDVSDRILVKLKMTKQKLWFYAKHAFSMLYLQLTVESTDVPKIHREPFIYKGFRPINKSWNYYLCSLFQIHNETGNIWSHLAAAVMFAFGTWKCYENMEHNDNTILPLLVFGLSITTYALLSALAHLLQSKSQLAHLVFYSLDYVGISIFGYGTGILVYYYSGSEQFHQSFIGSAYMYISFALNANLLVMLVIAKLYFPNQDSVTRKLLFSVSSLSSQSFMSTPIWMRLYECLTSDNVGPVSNMQLISNHFAYFIVLALSAFFFVTFIPESLYPGQYDIVGHSHQIFHLGTIFLSLAQLKAGYSDYIHQPHSLLQRLNPTLSSTFAGYFVLLFFGGFIISLMRNKIADCVKKEP